MHFFLPQDYYSAKRQLIFFSEFAIFAKKKEKMREKQAKNPHKYNTLIYLCT